jgi:hypothetical protein
VLGARTTQVLGIALACLVEFGCAEAPIEIDPFPIFVDLDAGVLRVKGSAPEILPDATFDMVIDTSAALTLIDPHSTEPQSPTRRRVALTVHGISSSSTSVPRARFSPLAALVTSTADGHSILGGDALSQVALRIQPSRSRIHFFLGIAGDARTHEDNCEAVFATGLQGGGVYSLGAGVVPFKASRIVLGACLEPASPDEPGDPGGHDALLVVSTGVGPTVLSRTAFVAAGGVVTADQRSLYLPGATAPETLDMGVLSRLALTAQQSTERGPCTELAISRTAERGSCTASIADCGCNPVSQQLTCSAGATVELGGPIQVAILEDTHPILQALRDELRPNVASVSGFLGMSELARLESVDLDYPNGRVLMKCGASATCKARPRVDFDDGRQCALYENGCLGSTLPKGCVCPTGASQCAETTAPPAP